MSKPVHGVLKRIRWEEPPPKKIRGVKSLYERHADTLRSNPGRWAVIANNVKGPNISGLRKRFPDLEFVFRAHESNTSTKNPKGAIYARYPEPEPVETLPVPEESEAPKVLVSDSAQLMASLFQSYQPTK